MADGDVAGGIMGVNPIQNGQLTREEIEKAEADPSYRMKVSRPQSPRRAATKRKGPRYTPISRRNERPNAIRWLLRNHPELKDAQIMRLVGTTKSTIDSVRDNTHWNSTNIQPMDPVTLGLCSQIDLDLEVKRAAAKAGTPLARRSRYRHHAAHRRGSDGDRRRPHRRHRSSWPRRIPPSRAGRRA